MSSGPQREDAVRDPMPGEELPAEAPGGGDLASVAAELDRVIEVLSALPDVRVRDQVLELMQLVDRLHRPALEALTAGLEAHGLLDAALENDAVRALLGLYELTPADDVTRADLALEAVRPYIHSHGGAVEVLVVEEGVVHLRLQGACGSCAASADTLRHGVEAALREGFEGFVRLEVHEPVAAPADDLVTLRAPVFDDLLAIDELVDRRPRAVRHGDRDLLLVRVDGDVHAFAGDCPTCRVPLAEGSVSGAILVCPMANCAFDVRSGRRVDGMDDEGLGVLPVALRGGRVLLAAGTAPVSRLATA